MVGIDVLKKDLIVLAKLANAIDSALEDDKVSAGETIKIAFKAVELIGVVKSLKAAKAEIVDLTEEEVAELYAEFVKEFDLTDDAAEEAVETLLQLALNIINSLGLVK